MFCGTCGSPLSPSEATAIAEDAAKTTVIETTPTDESVVPGKGGARRDLGTGGATGKTATVVDVPTGTGGAATDTVITDAGTDPGGGSIVCSVCGTVNDATRTYCRKCANELKPLTAAPPPPPATTEGRKISPLAIGLGAAAVVVAIALVAVLALGGGGPAATLSPTARATAATTAGPTTPAATVPGPSAPVFTEGDPSGRILFARCKSATVCALFAINPADGTETGPLTKAGGFAVDPAISNDGKRVVYTTKVGLRIRPIDGGAIVTHSTGTNDLNPYWSPDDSKLVFVAARTRDPAPNEDLEIRLDGVTDTGSSEPLTTNDVEDHDPVFTPDGLSVIWVQGKDNGRELKMINLESRDVKDLTSDEFNDVDPAVSPDGKQVVFASKRGTGNSFDLFLLDLATLDITPLPTMAGDEHDPAWSPGGRYIVFSGGDPAKNDLFILDLADSSVDPLTSGAERDLAPSWR